MFLPSGFGNLWECGTALVLLPFRIGIIAKIGKAFFVAGCTFFICFCLPGRYGGILAGWIFLRVYMLIDFSFPSGFSNLCRSPSLTFGIIIESGKAFFDVQS